MIRNYDKCALLVPFSGANNSTAIVDYGLYRTPYWVTNQAKITTADSKYYGSSAIFDGTGDYFPTDVCSGLNLTGDFTISFHFKFSAATRVYGGIFSNGYSSYSSGGVCIMCGSTNLWLSKYGASTLPSWEHGSPSEWKHIMFRRSGTTLDMLVDGAVVSSVTYSGAFNFNGGGGTRFGRNAWDVETSSSFAGGLQDFIVINGAAEDAADLSPQLIQTISNSGTTAVVDSAGFPLAGVVVQVVPRGIESRAFTSITDASGIYSVACPIAESNVLFLDPASGSTYEDLMPHSRVFPGA
jgi:hypothetical protein